MCWHACMLLAMEGGRIIAEPKGEASNCDALSFRVDMYVCIRRLCNAIPCLCMYIRNACAIQSYARLCMSVTLAQLLCNSVAKMCYGDDYSPALLPGLCDPYLMEKHDPQAFQSLPCSLRIV